MTESPASNGTIQCYPEAQQWLGTVMYSYSRNEVTTHDEYKRHQQTGEGRHTWIELGHTNRAVTSKLRAATAHCMPLLQVNVGNTGRFQNSASQAGLISWIYFMCTVLAQENTVTKEQKCQDIVMVNHCDIHRIGITQWWSPSNFLGSFHK